MAEIPEAPRIRRTTRDPVELTRRLASWLAAVHPGARPAAVTVPDSNGMSSETLLFDIEQEEAAAPPPVRRCVLRLAADPNAYTIFPAYDMTRQYKVMRLVAAHTDLPVPAVHWLETDPAHLGAEFFVMERVEGRVPPDVMPYTYEGNWLHAATAAEREQLERASVSVLARLHDQVPVSEAGVPHGTGKWQPAAATCGGPADVLRLGRRRPSALTRHRGRLRPVGGAVAGRGGRDGAQLGRRADRQHHL